MRRRVVVVGSGTRFLSGISVYTVRLANALARGGHRVSLVTMRQLLPTRLYPGHRRVGAALTDLRVDPRVARFDGIDWHWLPSLPRGAAFLLRRRPHVVILQWWTGTVLHTYLVLAVLARLAGARVVIEFHEVLDTGEVRIPLWRTYARIVGAAVVRLADGFAVHSTFDRDLLRTRYRLGRRPVALVPHGPYEHYRAPDAAGPALREAPAGTTNLVYFGVIRPYKGLEDLVAAFDAIPDEEIDGYWLTVVGETWEGWTLPAERIAASRHRDRITFVNRYVHDRELDAYLRGADAIVLPYRRSSISGPLHVAMAYGLPIVMTDVGGNTEAADGYGGLVLVPPADPPALREALRRLPAMRGMRSSHAHSWGAVVERYERLFRDLGRAPADVAAKDRAEAAPQREAA